MKTKKTQNTQGTAKRNKMKNVLSGTQCACRSWWNTSKHFFWFRVQALISLWVLLIYYLTLLLIKWEISHTADSTPQLIRDYVLTLWLNETPLNNNNNNNNNHHYHHVRGEIAELNQILINLTMPIPLHSCYHINECSGLPVIWENHTFFLRPVPLSPWCCFPKMQYEIIQSGATESVYYPKLRPEKLQREWLHSKRDLHLCKKQKRTLLDVLIRRSMHL